MQHALLEDRQIIAVRGEDAESFLNRLFTNSLLEMKPGAARYAALLSPQGKLLFDFLVLRRADGFWIDVACEQAVDLAKRLILFKLRAKVTIDDKKAELAVVAAWDGALMEAPGPAFRDPRHNDLGYRIVMSADAAIPFAGRAEAYEAHRVGLGIPRGGTDFFYGDTFVHDANIDLLNGVDFDKGCYVGQEVVSRVHHRGSARKRIVRLTFYGDPPAVGSRLQAGSAEIGQVTSITRHDGLASVRIDRLVEAEHANVPILAGDTLASVVLPVKNVVSAPSYADNAI